MLAEDHPFLCGHVRSLRRGRQERSAEGTQSVGPLLSFLFASRHNTGELIKGCDTGEHRGNQGAGTSSVGHNLPAARGEAL